MIFCHFYARGVNCTTFQFLQGIDSKNQNISILVRFTQNQTINSKKQTQIVQMSIYGLIPGYCNCLLQAVCWFTIFSQNTRCCYSYFIGNEIKSTISVGVSLQPNCDNLYWHHVHQQQNGCICYAGSRVTVLHKPQLSYNIATCCAASDE